MPSWVIFSPAKILVRQVWRCYLGSTVCTLLRGGCRALGRRKGSMTQGNCHGGLTTCPAADPGRFKSCMLSIKSSNGAANGPPALARWTLPGGHPQHARDVPQPNLQKAACRTEPAAHLVAFGTCCHQTVCRSVFAPTLHDQLGKLSSPIFGKPYQQAGWAGQRLPPPSAATAAYCMMAGRDLTTSYCLICLQSVQKRTQPVHVRSFACLEHARVRTCLSGQSGRVCGQM